MLTPEDHFSRASLDNVVEPPQPGTTGTGRDLESEKVNGACRQASPAPDAVFASEHGPSRQASSPGNGDGHVVAPLWLGWGEPDPALKGRTRFFIELAEGHGPRLSALVFLVAVHTDGKRRKGRRGRKNAWHQTAAWYGEQLGVSTRQVGRLMAQAAEVGLMDYERTGRGLLAWVVGKRPWGWLDQHRRGEYVVGHYDKDLANRLGITGACILNLLSRPREKNDIEALYQFRRLGKDLGLDAEGMERLIREVADNKPMDEDQAEREREYRQLDYKGVHRRLPWITEKEADNALRRLCGLGLIKRKPLDRLTAGLRGTRWIYYSEKCLQKPPGDTPP